jgi:hypothetical protein
MTRRRAKIMERMSKCDECVVFDPLENGRVPEKMILKVIKCDGSPSYHNNVRTTDRRTPLQYSREILFVNRDQYQQMEFDDEPSCSDCAIGTPPIGQRMEDIL